MVPLFPMGDDTVGMALNGRDRRSAGLPFVIYITYANRCEVSVYLCWKRGSFLKVYEHQPQPAR
jgi:hypothetical protein